MKLKKLVSKFDPNVIFSIQTTFIGPAKFIPNALKDYKISYFIALPNHIVFVELDTVKIFRVKDIVKDYLFVNIDGRKYSHFNTIPRTVLESVVNNCRETSTELNIVTFNKETEDGL